MTKTMVTIETPLTAAGDQLKAEEIPLPPEAMWKDLDNSGGKPGAAQPAEPPAPRPRETLDFVGTSHERSIPLEYPFRRDGGVVSEIRVRRLTIGEVGELMDGLPKGSDNFDIYAAMTGLPAPVLRGLIDIDGEQVTGACYDFLPRLFRPKGEAGSSSTQGDGA